ncbi:hypothetical protein Pint_05851 [Pistacia integerrima]|uniref:Uncharacterized protein n=1 Tax=Pistacia integerrima TaxID=434235 RepID=A0ACC0Z4F3_9ROSI|nr:hypothetical protein Pint_05851 [Pistacia integerrima]
MLMKMNLMGIRIFFIILIMLWLSSSAFAAYGGGSAKPPPSPSHSPPRRVRCQLRQYPACYQAWHLCPSICSTSCLVDCVTCRPICSCDNPGAVCQDPRFVGGDGNTFYFHGHKDQDFCLLSDANLHINAHFIGKRDPSMNRDFTWVQSISVIFNSHNLFIAAKTTSIWDDNIDHFVLSFDANSISLPPVEGSSWKSPSAPVVSITRAGRDTNFIAAEVEGSFRVTALVVPISEKESRAHGYNITADNCFAHLELGFKFYNLSDMVDGILGQTYRKNYVTRAKIGAKMPVLGGADKFLSSSIFATDCLASRYGKN